MFIYMYTQAHSRKDFSKNMFILKITSLNLLRELLVPTNCFGYTKNNGCKNVILRKYDFGDFGLVVRGVYWGNIHSPLCKHIQGGKREAT